MNFGVRKIITIICVTYMQNIFFFNLNFDLAVIIFFFFFNEMAPNVTCSENVILKVLLEIDGPTASTL